MGRSDDEPPPLPREKSGMGCFLKLLIGGTIVVFLGLMTIGILIERGYLLDSKVVRWEELGERHQRALRDEILRPDESAIWFYTFNVIDATWEGNMLTDQRVIRYGEFGLNPGGEFEVMSAELEDVIAIDVDFKSGFLDDTMVLVWKKPEVVGTEADPDTYSDSSDSFELILSTEEDVDHQFVRDFVQGVLDAGGDLRSVSVDGNFSDEELAAIPLAERGTYGE